MRNVLVIGGAGYVGSVLVPKLLDQGYGVRVLDTFWFGNTLGTHPSLQKVKADIRDKKVLDQSFDDIDYVIHLACISNDPSFELNPKLGRSVNYDAFLDIIEFAKGRVKRLIYVSSSSVYGVKQVENVTEDLACEPVTDYSKFKVFCELELRTVPLRELPWITVRPATVCGWSPRLRLDLTVNILTLSALHRGEITVYGGSQKRPNVHIDDITDLYIRILEEPHEEIVGKVFNAGWDNMTIMEIAKLVQEVVGQAKGKNIPIKVSPTNDLRSYHISSEKIKKELGWQPQKTVKDAICELVSAYSQGLISNPDDPKYSNVKKMQRLGIS